MILPADNALDAVVLSEASVFIYPVIRFCDDPVFSHTAIRFCSHQQIFIVESLFSCCIYVLVVTVALWLAVTYLEIRPKSKALRSLHTLVWFWHQDTKIGRSLGCQPRRGRTVDSQGPSAPLGINSSPWYNGSSEPKALM